MNYSMYQQQQWHACGSDALENQHSRYLRSTKQYVLFKKPQNSSPKRKRDAWMKRVKTSESLKCQLTSCEKNQNPKCQSKYNKVLRAGWPVLRKLWHIGTSPFKKFMTNLWKWKKLWRQNENVLRSRNVRCLFSHVSLNFQIAKTCTHCVTIF